MTDETQQNNKKTISGKVDRIVYKDLRSERTILSLIREDGKTCRVIGYAKGIAIDNMISATGAWRKDEKYGWQFLADTIELTTMEDKDEAADDGVMHAVDFSNVLGKHLKEFRTVAWPIDYEEEPFEDEEEPFEDEEEPFEDEEWPFEHEEDTTGEYVAAPTTVRGEDGALYSQDMTTLIEVPRDCLHFTIPDTVTHIGQQAFMGCKKLSSINIPDAVTSIGNSAFLNCSGLEIVRITDLSKWCKINFGCGTDPWPYFEYVSSNPLAYAQRLELNGNIVKDLVIPEDITFIKNLAFYKCKSLESITTHKGLSQIGKLAFYGCGDLEVKLPLWMNETEKDSFWECRLLIKDKTLKYNWRHVRFSEDMVSVPCGLGCWTDIEEAGLNSHINRMREYLATKIPCLIVHFDADGHATVVNAKELHDVVITQRIKENLAALIREGYQPAEILKRIDGLSPKYVREFIPRDMTPYIKFLLDKHAADRYPIVPIEEFIGGSLEEGALYTIMIDGQPNIVWENNNDARSTYVFRCSEGDYEATRQLVFDYIMAQEKGKRKLLHTDKCLKVFKEKPRMLVHNNFNSWAQRLMCDPDYKIDIGSL